MSELAVGEATAAVSVRRRSSSSCWSVPLFSVSCLARIVDEADKAQNSEKFVAGTVNEFLSNAVLYFIDSTTVNLMCIGVCRR